MAGTQGSTQGFSDRTVVLCRPDDPELAMRHGPTGGFEQSDDGPVRVVVSALTSDAKCERLGNRFGIEASRLLAFREAPGLARVVICDSNAPGSVQRRGAGHAR